MACLKEHGGKQGPCQALSREYLECRMSKGLMQCENLDDMGLDSNAIGDQKKEYTSTHEGRKESKSLVWSHTPADFVWMDVAEGFVAGLGVKQKRYS